MNHQIGENTPENQRFRERVWDIVRQIPEGQVTSYGAIARALGAPRNARQVGWAMRSSPNDPEFPAHRVIASDGKLTAGWLWGHPEVLKQRLLDEGIPFKAEYQVDIRRCLWVPPSAAAAPDEVHDFDDIARLEDR